MQKSRTFQNPLFLPFSPSDPISLKNLESKLVTYFLKPVTMEKKSQEKDLRKVGDLETRTIRRVNIGSYHMQKKRSKKKFLF